MCSSPINLTFGALLLQPMSNRTIGSMNLHRRFLQIFLYLCQQCLLEKSTCCISCPYTYTACSKSFIECIIFWIVRQGFLHSWVKFMFDLIVKLFLLLVSFFSSAILFLFFNQFYLLCSFVLMGLLLSSSASALCAHRHISCAVFKPLLGILGSLSRWHCANLGEFGWCHCKLDL